MAVSKFIEPLLQCKNKKGATTAESAHALTADTREATVKQLYIDLF